MDEQFKRWLEERLTRIDSSLGELVRHSASADVTLARQAKDLEHHIRRTDIAEQSISLIRDDLKPVKKHVAMMEGALKLVTVLALIVALVGGSIKILKP